MVECESCRRLAVKVLNLRRALTVANNLLAKAGNTLLVGVNEDAGPTFRGGRSFWSRVRKLIHD